LANCKKELNKKTPIIAWRFLVNRYNENEIGNAKKLSREIGVDELKINKFRCDMGKELLLDNDKQFKNVSSWLPTNESFSYYDYAEKRKQKTADGCGRNHQLIGMVPLHHAVRYGMKNTISETFGINLLR
jgi:hypothetical protein